MKRVSCLLAALIVVVLTAAAFAGIEPGKAAPLFSLKDVNGKEVKLADFKKQKSRRRYVHRHALPVFKRL